MASASKIQGPRSSDGSRTYRCTIDLTTDQYEFDAVDEDAETDNPAPDDELEVIHELTPTQERDFRHALVQPNIARRGYRVLSSTIGPYDIFLKPEMGVQLRENADHHRHFFWIKKLLRDSVGTVTMRGMRLKRHQYIHYKLSEVTGKPRYPILPLDKNDLAMQLRSTPNRLGSPLHDECWETLSIKEVECEREIIFTNQTVDEFNYTKRGMTVKRNGVWAQDLNEEVEEHGVLVCRWKYVEEFDGTKPVAYQLVRLNYQECDVGWGVPDVSLRCMYGRASTQIMPLLERVYAYGDACTGPGGCMIGADRAGLNVMWAIDDSQSAIDTLRLNWPRARILKMKIQDFVVTLFLNEDFTVDVLHISFPCQGFSLANPGSNPVRDAENNNTTLALGKMIQKCRPRVVTLEQTPGITSSVYDQFYYRKLLQSITDEGYSVRWRVLNMQENGVSQARKRLIVIAACPGQELPAYPQPTHGSGPGLQPIVTLGQAIASIPFGASRHEIEAHKRAYHARSSTSKLTVADVNLPQKHLITCKGAQFLLVDGGQSYAPTIRQQMRLQTFPDDYEIAGTKTEACTQIGNAVPPVFMRQIDKEIIKTLKRSDGEAEQWNAETVDLT